MWLHYMACIARPVSGSATASVLVPCPRAPPLNRITAWMAEEGIRASAAALPRLAADPKDLEARGDALYGAWLCGTVLGAVAMGLHHKLCHTLGGNFNLPRAEVHTVILPHALADNAAQGVFELASRHGAPTSLRAIGMPAEGLDRAAELTVETPRAEPAGTHWRTLRPVHDAHRRRPGHRVGDRSGLSARWAPKWPLGVCCVFVSESLWVIRMYQLHRDPVIMRTTGAQPYGGGRPN